MNQPLGYAIGNWLEAREAHESLQGKGPEDVMQVTHQLAGTMIYLGGEAATIEEGIDKSKQAVANGTAWEKWQQVVAEQGGDTGLLEDPEKYPETAYEFEVQAPEEGFIEAMDAFQMGMASVELGAGRRSKEDKIDPAAGIMLVKKIGDPVKKGETIARAFTNNKQVKDVVVESLAHSITIGENKPARIPLSCKISLMSS